MTQSNGVVNALLLQLRQHPAFPELLKAIPAPQIPRYRRSQAEKAESARADWIYHSGKRDQHEAWLAFLTGKPIPRHEE